MKNIVVFDLDGTLTKLGDRVKYLKNNDYAAFNAHCDEDDVKEHVAVILRSLRSAGYKIKIVTGRSELYRIKTLSWLAENNLSVPSEDLIMRPDGDWRHDVVVKFELVGDFIDQVAMAFDDRKCNVEKWRSLGVPCLSVDERDF